MGGHKPNRTNLRVAARIVDSLQAGHPLIFPEIDIQDVWAELGANGEMALCIGYFSHFDSDRGFVYRSTMGPRRLVRMDRREFHLRQGE